MDKKTIRTLINKDEIESCFVTSKTHKNYWYYNNKKIKRILPMMKMYSSRQKKKPILEKILALLLHQGQVYGGKEKE